MANNKKRIQSHLDKYVTGTRKRAKLDSSVNQSDSPETISSNNGDITTGDDSGNAISSNKVDPKDINDILESKLSIFKLANNRLAGLKENQDDIKKFGQCINKVLIKKGTRYQDVMGDTFAPFHLMCFFQFLPDH